MIVNININGQNFPIELKDTDLGDASADNIAQVCKNALLEWEHKRALRRQIDVLVAGNSAPGIPANEYWKNNADVKKCLGNEYLELSGGYYRTTSKGFDWSVNIPMGT